MNKNQSYHHSITENGNLQLRIITQYVEDGEVKSEKYSNPVAPADTMKMDGWDDKSKAIVEAITDKAVVADFAVENLPIKTFSDLSFEEKCLTGVFETVTYDRTLDDLGRISVRRITRIFDDGEEVSKKYHRSWIMPGDDYSGADVMSRALAKKLHTAEIVAAYAASQAENVAVKK